MIGNGLDPDLATTGGDTILHSAARTGYPRVIRLLLQKGGDAGARNGAGQTPLDIAIQGQKNDAAELLRNPGSIPKDYYARRYAYDSKFGALKRDDTEGLPKEFINAFTVVSHFGFDRVKQWVKLCPELLNTRAAWDELPVEAAAHMGRADIGGHLLDLGASYSICTATVFGSLDDVKHLLAEDSQRIHERGAHSFPLLWYTAFGKPKIDAAEFLIHMGADPNEDMRTHGPAYGGFGGASGTLPVLPGKRFGPDAERHRLHGDSRCHRSRRGGKTPGSGGDAARLDQTRILTLVTVRLLIRASILLP